MLSTKHPTVPAIMDIFKVTNGSGYIPSRYAATPITPAPIIPAAVPTSEIPPSVPGVPFGVLL